MAMWFASLVESLPALKTSLNPKSSSNFGNSPRPFFLRVILEFTTNPSWNSGRWSALLKNHSARSVHFNRSALEKNLLSVIRIKRKSHQKSGRRKSPSWKIKVNSGSFKEPKGSGDFGFFRHSILNWWTGIKPWERSTTGSRNTGLKWIMENASSKKKRRYQGNGWA